MKKVPGWFQIRLLFLLCLVISSTSQAAVSVTTASAASISADGAANSTTTPTYTTLGNIVLAEGANTDFSNGTGLTLILGAPTGWTFNPGAGSVTFQGARDISAASISITSTTATITLTVGNTTRSDTLTISGLQVRANEGANIPGTGSITRIGGTAAINGAVNGTVFGTLGLVAGVADALLLTLPGQTFTDGTTEAASGISGTATSQTAGTAFNISRITAVDQFLNVVTAYSGAKTITYSGPGGIPTYTTAVTFASGLSSTSLATTLTKAETTAISVSDGAVAGPPSSNLTVNPGTFNKLQLLLPGEVAAAGTVTGKSGAPASQSAGSAFLINVNAVDANWNLVSSSHTVSISASDPNAIPPANAALVAGTISFSLTLKTAGTATLTATNVTDGTKTASTSPSITVNAGALAKLQVLLPGETAAPGTANGKTGSPTAQTAGAAFNITVRSVDANWNLVNSTHTTSISSSDPNATLPVDAALVAGSRAFSVTFKTAGSATVSASDVTDGSISPAISSSATVNPGTFTKLQLLVPGETTSPGSPTGKTGGPASQPAGSAFAITVNAVDANWNLVSSTDTISITSSDSTATLPPNAALVAGTKSFTVTFSKSGSATLTASDVTNTARTANTSPAITVNAGAFTKLQVLLPGETAAPGTTSGKTGTPTAQTAGTTVNLTVNAVDANWNIVNSASDTVAVVTTDSNATLSSSSAALVSGTKSFSLTFKTAGSQSATVSNTTNGSITPNTSATITINAGTFAKMQLLLPGEAAAPGSSSGKTGSPSSQTAGSAFSVTVNSVDAFWNLVTSTHTVGITSSDPNAVLPANAALTAGSRSFSVTLKTAQSTSTLTASNITDATKTANTSPALTVNAAAFSKLQLLLPGESTAPGSTSGKTGTPSARTAAVPFSVTVNAVDAFWNLVSSSDTIAITSSDTVATLPSNAPLAAGTASFSVTFRKAGTATLTASDVTDSSKTAQTSPTVTVNAGSFSKLQILLPGETAAPGTTTGKTGSPTARTAGTAFNVTVNSVDESWNLVSSTDTVAISSSDPNATLPANAALTAGTRTFSVTLKTAGSATVTATDVTTPARMPDTSSSATVNAGVFTKMQLLVPGETAAPGTTTGKTGSPAAQTGGSSFNVTVRAVDAFWNLTASGNTIAISSSDPNASLPPNAALTAGSQSFAITLKTAGSATLTSSNVTDGTKTANTSPAITVAAGAFAKLQLLLPGETAAPGTATGKTGSPTTQTAGTAFNVTARAVDANWNLVSATDSVSLAASDANASLPASTPLAGGTATLSVTLKRATPTSLTLSNVTDATKTAFTSPSIAVNAGAFTKLQLLVPGETAAPGTSTGKTGSPASQTAGSAFSLTVNSVDANWNAVSSTDTVAITSSDTNATLPPNAALAAGTRSFSVTLKTAGNPTLTASDITTPARTAHTSPPIPLSPGTFVKLQLLVPGESAAPGSSTGKTGSPSSLAAGTAYNLTVNAVDANWNVVTSSHTIAITSTDVNAALPANSNLTAGTSLLSFMFKTAGTWTLSATNVTDGTKTANTSPSLTVTAGAFSKLQILLPGETAVAGTASGKTGTPSAQTAGTAFNVLVNAVDSTWNKVSSTHTVSITSSDSTATLPASAPMAAGTATFSITLKKAGSSTVTANNITDGTKSPNISSSVTVNPGTFAKLQLLFPGESSNPGSSSGKSGTPATQAAGSSFSLAVNAVDANWNPVSASDTIQITSSDSFTLLPSNASLVNGSQSFAVTAKRAGTMTFTATDLTDGTKTASTTSILTVIAGPLVKLQLIVPGETAAPGTTTGKIGTPIAQSESIPFNIVINAVDTYWNVVTTSSHTVRFTSTDTAATLPSNTSLSGGTATLSFTFATRGINTITATDISDPGVTASTSPDITVGRTYTPASGGEAISADGVGGSYTLLSGPIYSESNNGDVTTGTILLNAPTGFIFDTGGTLPTVLITRLAGSGANSRNINGVASGTAIAVDSVSPTQISVTITSVSNSGVNCRLTWQNIRVRPTSGTPLVRGSITKAGTTLLPGVDADTDLGPLVMVAGAANRLTIQTEPAEAATAGLAFSPQPIIRIEDQFGNLRSLANGTSDNTTVVTATRTAGAGILQGSVTATALNGLAPFAGLNHQLANSITITFSSPGLVSVTSRPVLITPAPAVSLGFSTHPGSAYVGSPFGTQPSIITKDQFGNPSSVSLPSTVPVSIALTAGTGTLLNAISLDIGSSSGNGVIFFSGLTLDRAGSGKQLTASATGFSSTLSDPFVVAKGVQTITFPPMSAKTYGNAPFTPSATVNSTLPISYQVLSGPATASASTVTITGAGLVTLRASQAGNDDYEPAVSVDQSFTVNKAQLTATADNIEKVYGAGLPSFTASFSGFVNGDTSAVVSGSPIFSTTALQSSPVGTYPITVQAGTLTASNYNFSFADGTLTITRAPLTVTAADASKVYGAALPSFSVNYSGFVNGDNAFTLTTPVTLSCAATATSPAGAYAIVPNGGAHPNYTLTLVSGTLTVSKAILTVRADDKRAVYNCSFPALTASYSGFVNSETASVLSGSPNLTATGSASSPVGNYSILVTLGTLAADNYTFSFLNGSLIVAERSLPSVVSSMADQQIYEDNSITVAFSVTDPDNDVSEITMLGRSLNTSLVAPSGFVFTGTGINRTVTIQPATNAVGSATIEIVALDSCSATSTNRFVLSILPVNDPPTFTLSTSTVTVFEDADLTAVSNLATDVTSGPPNEPDEFDTFFVTPSTHSSFSVIPVVNSGGSLFFKPAPNAFGTYTFALQVKDQGGTANGGSNTSPPAQLTIIILPINDPPIIAGLSAASILEDRSGAFPFTLRDLESAPDDLSIIARSLDQTIISDFGLVISGQGTNRTINITPVPNAAGTATVELVASDTESGITTNRVAVTVQAVNDPPSFQLSTDSFLLTEDAPAFALPGFATNIVAGLPDESAQLLSFIVTTTNKNFFAVQPAVSSSGTLQFRTATNAFGTNFLSVRLKDSGGTANSGVDTSPSQDFTVVVTAENDPPFLAGLAAQTVNEDSPGAFPFAVADVDTAVASVSVTASSSNESLVPNSSLLISGTESARTLTVTPAPNLNGTATITMVADDGANQYSASFVLTVRPVNDAPSFVLSTSTISVLEDSPLVLTNLIASFSTGPSDESAQGVSYSITVTNAAFFASVPILSTNGLLQFRPATNVVGTNVIKVRIKDTGGIANAGIDLSASKDVSIVVLPINDSPTLTGLTAKTATEDRPLTFQFTVADIDSPIENLVLTVSSSNTALLPDSGILITGLPASTNRSLTLNTSINLHGAATVTVIASDNHGGAATNQFLLTVLPVNDVPQFTLSTATVTVLEDSALVRATNFVASISAGPTDESTQTLSFLVTSTSPNFFAVLPTISPTGILQFRPALNVNGTNIVRVQLKDSGGTLRAGVDLSPLQEFAIVAQPVNDAPVIGALPPRTINEDRAGSFPIVVRDIDSDLSLVSVVASSSDQSLVSDSQLTVTGTSTNRVLAVTPVPNAFGSATLTLVATDPQLASTTNSFVLTVLPVNDAPSFQLSTSEVTLLEDAPLLSITNFASNLSTGPGNESTQRLTFTVLTTNTAFFAVQPAITPDGILRFRPAVNVNGTNTVRVELRDSGGIANAGIDIAPFQSFSIVVQPVNDAPVLSAQQPRFMNEDRSGLFLVSVRDIDSDLSQVTVVPTSSNPALVPNDEMFVTGQSTNRILTVVPLPTTFGTTTITLIATDPQAASSTNSFVLTVQPINDPPSFQFSAPDVRVTEDSSPVSLTNFVVNLSQGPSNESIQTLSFIVTSTNTSFFSVQPSISPDGTLRFRPAPNATGTNTLRVQIKDSGGTISGGADVSPIQLLPIIVDPVNDAPFITLPSVRSMTEDSLGSFNIRISDIDSPPDSFVINATSSNELLLSQSDLTVTLTGTNCVLSLKPTPNANGTVAITLAASDQIASTNTVLVITVLPVNDAPSFQLTSQTITATTYGTQQRFTNFAFNIKPGPTNEFDSLAFVVTTQEKTLFSTQPAISPAGLLTFIAANAGTAQMTVLLRDSGNNLNGGTNLSPAQSFSIIVPPNPFPPLKGTYNGLFYEANQITHLSAGSFSLTLDANGLFSGKFTLGSSFSVSGQFIIQTGRAQFPIIRPGSPQLLVDLGLDISGSAATQISGYITDGSWTADLSGDRAVYNATNAPAPPAGSYTMVIPGNNNPAIAPSGDSVASITVDPNGSVRLSGLLADGTPITHTNVVSGVDWPLYVPLYAAKGSLISWIHFNGGPGDGFQGDLSWIKTASLVRYYPNGFTNDTAILSSSYLPPSAGTTILQFTSGSVILSGGNLATPLTNRVTLRSDNTFSVVPAPNALTISALLGSGQITGTFIHPVTKLAVPFRGVVLQNLNAARGFFLGPSESGLFVLQPDP